MSLKIFSQNLNYLMKKRKLSRSLMCEKLRIDSARLSHWTQSRAYPRTEAMVDLCNVLEYYDLYKLLTVDLSKLKIEEPKRKMKVLLLEPDQVDRLIREQMELKTGRE
jgi:transcriptional regulator with XRE-family HTH domain